MLNERAKKRLETSRLEFAEQIDAVCEWIDKKYDADRYELFGDEYAGMSRNAAKAMNTQLKRLLRKIPTFKIISDTDIHDIISDGMQDVREKYAECGASCSEARWAINDAVAKLINLSDSF